MKEQLQLKNHLKEVRTEANLCLLYTSLLTNLWEKLNWRSI